MKQQLKERKKLLNSLNFDTICDLLPNGFMVINLKPEYRIVYLNPAAVELLGYDDSGKAVNEFNKELVKGKKLGDKFICEESREAYHKVFQRLDSGEGAVVEKLWFKRDRRYCLRLTYTVFQNMQDGMLVSVLIQDVTEQESREAFYKRRMATLMKNNPETLGSLIINLTKNYVVDQQTLYDYIDKQPDKLSIDNYLRGLRDNFSILAEYERYCNMFCRESLMQRYEHGETSVEYSHRFLFNNNTEKCISTVGTIIRNPITDDLEVVVVASDMTEKTIYYQIAQQLVNEKYDIVALIYPKRGLAEFVFANNEYENTPEVMISSYEENRMKAARTLFDEAQGKKYLECTSLPVIISKLYEQQRYSFSNYRIVDGRKRTKLYNYIYLDDTHRAILCTVQDVTVFKEKEELQLHRLNNALADAQKANSAKSDFLSRMSHDIRTPMNAIINMTRFAKEDYRGIGNGDVLDDLDKLESTGKYMLDLLNDILDVSRIENGKMELNPTIYYYSEFANYIDGMIKPLCDKKHIRFIWDREKTARPLYMDKIRFNQLMFNLLSNAVKYTPEGGTVSFIDKIESVCGDNINCSFSIIDTGIGMSEEFQKKMFEPFSREDGVENIQGTGLGLAIIDKIVKMMNGTISVRSQKGKGSEFTVRLMLKHASPEQLETMRKEELSGRNVEFNGKCILVAEDHPLNMKIITRLLAMKNIKVIPAENGAQAVQLFAESEPGSIDAVLMDMRMPIMDGMAATKKIRSLERSDADDVVIIAMTANAFDEDRRAALKGGMNDYLTKPISPQALYKCLELCLK